MKKKLTFRQVINTLHLWVGIPCAIVLFIVCLTGTIYVFQKEITRSIDGDKYLLSPSASPRMSIASIKETVEAANAGLKVTVIQIPEKANEAWLLTLAPPAINDTGTNNAASRKNNPTATPNPDTEETGSEKAKIKKQTLIVNPYTGQVQGNVQSTTYRFFENVIALHRWLLLDHKIGAAITGTSAMLFVLLEITGLILWLPAKIKSWKKWNVWKPGFAIKRKAGWKRINHDLHKTLGFYTFLLITILGLTGPYFGFEWYRNAFAKAMGTTPIKKADADAPKTTAATDKAPKIATPETETSATQTKKDALKNTLKTEAPTDQTIPGPKKAEQKPLLLDSMLATANQTLPYNGDIRLNLPKGAKGKVSLLKTRTGFFASAAVDKIDFDAPTARIKQIELFKKKSIGEKIISLIRAIHTGEIFGTFSKIIYFLVCLIATSLPVTGIMIWWNKRKKKLPRQTQKQVKATSLALAE